jgi:hypothetical protein
MVSVQDMGLFQYREFEKYLPQQKMETITGEVLGARMDVSIRVLDEDSDYLQHSWERLYHDISYELMKRTIGRKDYFVTRFVPRMRDSENGWGIVLELLVDCFVAQTKNVYIPEIVYERSGIYTVIKEWRCGYCSSPNEMKERHCTQCGSPRALLIQEM